MSHIAESMPNQWPRHFASLSLLAGPGRVSYDFRGYRGPLGLSNGATAIASASGKTATV